jgi:hypothetical protein
MCYRMCCAQSYVLRTELRSWLQSSQVHRKMWTQLAVRQLQFSMQSSQSGLPSYTAGKEEDSLRIAGYSSN